jgi:uncharacterized protein YndB with AHSA1/START domain
MIANAKAATGARQTTIEVSGDRELVMTRTLNGPAKLAFRAWTEADLVARWWAPKSLGVEMVSAEADVRPGGRYRYVQKPQGHDAITFSGEYQEVVPYSRVVYTQVFEEMADAGAVVVTVTFTERDGQTDMVVSEVYPSAEAREGALASGMETGMRDVVEQLDALVESLAA